VHPGDRQIREGVAADVPRDKAVETKSVHEPARQAGHPLLPCVCPVSSLPSVSSTATQARKQNKPITNRTIRYSVFLFSLINVLVASGKLPTGESQMIVLAVLQYVPMFTLTPRFVMGIRELHARDVQSRRGGGIDTGFGLSVSNCTAGGTAIVFADVGQNEGLEGVETTGSE
jgi:hypothetical protein